MTLRLHVLEKRISIGTLIYVVMVRLKWRLAKGLPEGSYASTDLVGGSVIADLSVQRVPNNMGAGVYL